MVYDHRQRPPAVYDERVARNSDQRGAPCSSCRPVAQDPTGTQHARGTAIVPIGRPRPAREGCTTFAAPRLEVDDATP